MKTATKERVTFLDCLRESMDSEFVHQWARLRGVSFPTTPIDVMIDKATGYNDAKIRMFIRDVWDLVWERLPASAKDHEDIVGPALMAAVAFAEAEKEPADAD